MFEEADLRVRLVPYYADPQIAPRHISPYWRRYDRADLTVQIAFFVS
jgi:hypothetical protein